MIFSRVNYLLNFLIKITIKNISLYRRNEDRGGTVVKVLCYKSEGHWLDPSSCQWIFH